MDEVRQLRLTVEAIMQRMGKPVRLRDQRLQPPESLHLGYLTRGAGAEPPWEFRFLAAPPGLQEGSLLNFDGEPGRWRVEKVEAEHDGAGLLFVRAQVIDLDSAPGALPEDLTGLLQKLQALLERATLAPLERDDAAEALARLEKLSASAPGPGTSQRLHARLRLLHERLGSCRQIGHEAKGLLLRLEAHLKRKGLV
jgi:hypothetical protein